MRALICRLGARGVPRLEGGEGRGLGEDAFGSLVRLNMAENRLGLGVMALEVSFPLYPL